MSTWDAIVIGAGVSGGAAAWRLAQAGRRVLVLEQHTVGHDLGSSHGASRIIRLTYEEPFYVALAREAYTAWEELERASGETMIHRTGDLFFGPGGGPIEAYARSLEAAGVAFELLDPGTVARRFPAFRLPPGTFSLHQAESGILPASLCVATQVRLARAAGAEVREGAAVRALRRTPGGVEVVTDRGVEVADRVVLAAGGWLASLAPELALPLRVVRQQVAHFTPRGDPGPYRADRMPVWVYVGANGGDDFFYGLPIFGVFGAKAARHRRSGAGLHPDRVDRATDPAQIEDVREFLRGHIPGLADGDLVSPLVCLYTVTPDEHFVIDRHPDDPRIVIVSACSGHGFKFGSIIGSIAAELALEGRTRSVGYAAAAGRFGIARFGR